MKKNFTQGAVTKAVNGAKPGIYWTIGASYVKSDLGASISYLSSRNGGFGASPTFVSPSYSIARAKVQVISFGIDYKLAPGFMPYAEFTQFNVKDKSIIDARAKNSGALLLTGSKLQF